MAAIPSEVEFPKRPRISAPALRRALTAGMRRVLERREHLNKINVFPVPDGDTGSNLAFTLGAVLGGSLSRPTGSAGSLLKAVADDAIEGARGNSGAILAQFFCGASETVGNAHQLDIRSIAEAVRQGSRQARGALAQPREGTILSVIHAFAEALQEPGNDVAGWFGHGVAQARQALANTPKQLAVLRNAGVVDAGAQGFVDLVEGIHGYIDALRMPAGEMVDATNEEFAGNHWHEEADPAKPWCSECLVSGGAIDRFGLRDAVLAMGGDSLVIAGGAQRLRVHAHVADPAALFELAGRFGTVSARKAENMLAQHRAALRHMAVRVVTDSAADLPAGIGDSLPLDVVPVRVSFGEEDFLDRISLSNAEFYQRLRLGGTLPQTSQPPPGDFRRCFELLLSHAENIVYVGLSRPLSGTLQSGETAAARCPAGRVIVLDSGQVSCAQALLAIAAAECADRGGTVAEVRDTVARLAPRTHLFAAARDLQHIVRGGRIPAWVLPLARGLGLTALARITGEGTLGVCGALFGKGDVPERFAAWIVRRLPRNVRWRVMVGHCDAPDDARVLLSALRRRLAPSRDWLVETGPAIGAHAGPGTLVVGLQADADG